ncbi:hypothetical protein [Sphingomonas sp. ERG5]|uniref:hypothetical protein n=1 Tax=Sphingomonas sp. ERG5 TaxID=1381597 RepID=UPI00054B9815|nr:hypothetical protein [Sphingomonas sp. ERG5]
MKARGLASPDDADALALTFATPVMPREALMWLACHPTLRQLTEEEEWERTYRAMRPGNGD